MQTEQTQNELIIRETPGCLWIVGLLFAFVGGAFVYGALGGFTDSDKQAPWMLALAFLMGSIALGVGIWTIYRAPITRVVINRIENEVVITRYGLFGKQQSRFSFEDIDHFFLIEDRDDEGSPIWSLAIQLTNDEAIKISSLPSHDERYKQEFVFQANEFMHKQLASVEMILELTGEDDREIG